jgi:hypothetical protein
MAMKASYIGLLGAGAALAAGLAVTMTQPPPFPPPAAAQPVRRAVALPPPVKALPPVEAAPLVKPSPLPKTAPLPAPAPLEAAVLVAKPAAAPAPVYSQPPKIAIRKSRPVLIAKAAAPTDWTPAPYQEPARPSVPAAQPPEVAAPAPVPQPTPVQPPAPVQQPQPTIQTSEPAARHVSLQAGLTIPVRVVETLSTERSAIGDTFEASLAEPLVVTGLVIAEKGARVTGRVVASKKGGRAGGQSLLQLELSDLLTADGQHIPISTDPWTQRGPSSIREDAGRIGGGAAIGAIVGAVAGGASGAAIGAGIGGAAGAGSILASRGKPVNLPSETLVRFRLATRVTITEQAVASR